MDRLAEMEAFATVVDQGGFTDAARKLGISKSAVSKHVSALETRLGARLLHRTTRRVSPTEIGLVYYDRARRVLTDAGEADALVSSLQSAPSGKLRVSVATDFGVHCLSGILSEFMFRYPDIVVNIELSNRYVELLSEGFDAAVRIGERPQSGLYSRKLADIERRLIASPAYLEQFGRPRRIDDLHSYRMLHYSDDAAGNVWRFTSPSGERREIHTSAWLSVNDGTSLLNAAIAGLGIAYLPSHLYRDALRTGQLVEVIPELPPERQAVHVVYPAEQMVQPKVRAFVDFLGEAVQRSEQAELAST